MPGNEAGALSLTQDTGKITLRKWKSERKRRNTENKADIYSRSLDPEKSKGEVQVQETLNRQTQEDSISQSANSDTEMAGPLVDLEAVGKKEARVEVSGSSECKHLVIQVTHFLWSRSSPVSFIPFPFDREPPLSTAPHFETS